jgi:hypothetical protein
LRQDVDQPDIVIIVFVLIVASHQGGERAGNGAVRLVAFVFVVFVRCLQPGAIAVAD